MPKPIDDKTTDTKSKAVVQNPPADENAPVKGTATGEDTKPDDGKTNQKDTKPADVKPKKQKMVEPAPEKPGQVKMVLMRYYGTLPPGALIWPTEKEARELETNNIARRK